MCTSGQPGSLERAANTDAGTSDITMIVAKMNAKIFFMFSFLSKNRIWSSSCHAFDKILCLFFRFDTMLATPAYQASIDTLRHSITSRIIFYTTFWFLSIPFEKIIGKTKKFLSVISAHLWLLFIFGKTFIFCNLFLYPPKEIYLPISSIL